MSGGADVVVLGQKFHGLPPAEYAAALRDRLADHEVVVASTPAQQRRHLADATVATGSAFDASLLESADSLELFACAYAGYDHLPMAELADAGVAVTTAAGVHGPNVAEHAIGFVLTFARRFHEGWRRQQQRRWQSYPTRELAGSTVAIVGMGAIGEAIATRLDAFDVETVGIRHSPEKGGPVDAVLGYEDFHEGLTGADYLVLACPLTEQTRGLVGARELATLPTDAVVVNVARGGVVDTEALVSKLRGDRIGGAALDVTDPEPLPEDHPLWNLEDVLVTPHNAGYTPAYHERLADIVAGNVRAVEAGQLDALENPVRIPD